ncbi:hypothetical protein CcaverHIS002_0211180 [Cutaneotrichosporon cavernicola]|nr:hypothetical protein CcaverHIS002_0211180 [Cutaneotrichosporon cavernicola]
MASLFSGPPATRPLVLHSQIERVNILVPASPLSAWVASEVLAQEFHDSPLSKDDAAEPTADEDDEGAAVPTGPDNEGQVKLLARFLGFAADKLTAGGDQTAEIAQVVLAAYKRFNELFLGSTNIHTRVQSYDVEARAEILTAYFKAFAALRVALGASEVPAAHPSAVIEAAKAGDAELYGLFGGQGVNEYYFDELKALFDIYRPFVEETLTTLSQDVLVPLADKATAAGFPYYVDGLDVISWLNGSKPRPAVEYLASIPVSLPVIGITQLVQYIVSARIADVSPGDLRNLIKGATGHSQGIISAVAVAASSTWDELYANIAKAVKLLFYIGLRGQRILPARLA